MNNSRFLQIHALTAYPGTLLNRDDAGFAKRMPFGGATRTRISSQCLKRHWRTHKGNHSLGDLDGDLSIRSRLTFDREILRPLVEEGADDKVARAAVEELMSVVLGKSVKAKAKAEDDDDGGTLETGQVTVLGRPEVEFLRGIARDICDKADGPKAVKKVAKEVFDKEQKKNLKSLDRAAGLDAAVFGRMVTSDVLSARGDAAVHVAHAFTVHEQEAETDYFSAVDELRADTAGDEGGGLGSGHIGTSELTSGLFYSYVVVDVPLLVSNLEGCERADWRDADTELAQGVIGSIVGTMATVSPGAKLGSTAPYSWAQMMLAEVGEEQPRTLANAFMQPVPERPDLLLNTYDAFFRHLHSFDQMYQPALQRRIAGLRLDEVNGDTDLEACGVGEPVDLSSLQKWASATPWED